MFPGLMHDANPAPGHGHSALHGVAGLKWLAIMLVMAAAVGSACAFFLWSLDVVTIVRFDHPWLLYLLPAGGFLLGWIYQGIGKSAEGGNNLIIEQIHAPGGGVPRRMAPLILASTLLTHAFGGSAGREGTAVQMGGSIAGFFGRHTGMHAQALRLLLMTGIAAGFGAVFGTPFAGAVFALEVLTVGAMELPALLPCLLAALLGDWTCTAWGIHHTPYKISYLAGQHLADFHLDAVLLGKIALASAAFGLASRGFTTLSHGATAGFKKLVSYAPLRPAIGGALVILLVFVCGTRDYLGLGVWSADDAARTIPGFFDPSLVDHWSWLWKTVFTVVTLSSGFKGGEVTPLFFIGAALGNTLGHLLGAPVDLMAAIGFVAIFAGATNTPLASTLMAIELFGSTHAPYLAVGCAVAYLCSGHKSIYVAQRRLR